MKELMDEWVSLRRRLREPPTPEDPIDREELAKRLLEVEDRLEMAHRGATSGIVKSTAAIGVSGLGASLNINEVLGHALGGLLQGAMEKSRHLQTGKPVVRIRKKPK